ncbi:hypothetical protein BH20ACI2_BH20ACI2_22230 [soil metagenome]
MKTGIFTACSDLQKVADDARETFGSLSAVQLNWKPSDENWSIAQCFEHLIVTNELYFPNIQRVIDGNHRNNFYSKIPFATDLIAFAMKNSLNPNQSKKMKNIQDV